MVFNDKNIDKTNQNILIYGISQVTKYNFLDSLPFNEKFDWVVFNPQIGGSYKDGVSALEANLEIRLSSYAIDDYLKQELGVEFEFTTQVDDTKKTITIHSDSANKSEMQVKLKDLRVWNYYDIFYQSGQSKREGIESNVVKLRKILMPL